MIKPLRKRHLQVWSAFLVLMPAAIVTAWLSVKHPAHDQVLQPFRDQLLPHILVSAESKNYIVRLRSNHTVAEQVEWINKKVLTVPSAVIYKSRPGQSDFNTAEWIGRIEATGNYSFALGRDSTNERPTFILYDFIHEKIIDSVKF